MAKRLANELSVGKRAVAVSHYRRPWRPSEIVALMVINPQGRLVMVNHRALEVTGYSREDLNGQFFSFLLATEDRRGVRDRFDSLLKQGRRFSRVEIEIVRRDGARRTVSLDMEVLRIGRTPLGVLVAARDSIGATDVQDPLMASDESAGFLVEAANDVVLAVDEQDTVCFVSAGIEGVLGYRPSELVGKKITVLLPKHAQPPPRERWSTHFQDKKRVLSWHGIFYPLLHKDGREITVDMVIDKINAKGHEVAVAMMRDVTGRIKLEMAMRENDLRQRLGLEVGRTTVWDWDISTDTITWYREVYEAFGLEVSTVQSGRTRLQRVHPEDRASLQETIDKALRNKSEYCVAYRLASNGKGTRWVEERGVGVYNGAGKCVSIRGVVCDVEDRKKAEKALQASEERYRVVVETQTDLICRFLPDTTLTFVNDAYCRFFSRRREDVMGTKFLQFIPEPSHKLILDHIRSLIEDPTPQPANLEHQIVTSGGASGWMHWINHVIVDPEGGVLELQGIGRDITDRRRLQENLIRREQEFSSLVENLPDIVSRLDRDLRFLYVSPNVKLLFGISAQNFVGKRPHEVKVDGYQWSGFENACRQVLTTGKAADREFVWGKKCYRARIVPEFGLIGKVESVLCIDQDISEQKRIEAELRRLSSRLLDLQDAERRRIAREMHDCTAQNLFAISMGLSRLLKQRDTSNFRSTLEECLSLCEQSREEIRTLSYLLHPPMLDEAGLLPAMKWYVDGFSKRTGIKVDLDVRSKGVRLPVEIETDLFRILQESLANIHRHSGSPTAAVRLDRMPGCVVLEIRDWGCGMPVEVTQSNGSGGVGIPGMRERVCQLHGCLDIESSDRGTTITAVIPVKNAKAATAQGANGQRTAF
jgi:PAS domain S-box-containing protein